ncbi:S8 family serine peptidase [Actinoplanes derwentensis]|uniref:Ig-like domain (Group 3) n=1 Tax=Actinoplanes derwentensis TaxID=113562 RepID=A0A1H2CK94_9ACTN|nr:S8 family serine peptidase [Actinoplanes derwentensis]GID82670.1 hypothetical protein Ade03nite_15940 [Actinoplanes derwentensis]SDT70920.1 Ig-like domain (group 3) [Actinoplanes derwentensis]
MKSLHRRIVVGLSATALLAGAGIAAISANASVTSAATPELPVRLLVGLRAGVAPEVELATLGRFGLAEAGSLSKSLLSEVRVKSISVPSGRASAVTAALKLDPNVSYVEVDHVATKLDVTPNDPYFAYQPELPQIKVPTAWDTTKGKAIKVAVVDTGVKVVGDLVGKVLPGYDFVNRDKNPTDDEGHGTIVASLIAAKTNNGAGMAGVCEQCQILPVKVLDKNGEGYYSAIANGVIYAAKQGAKVINLSLGGKSSAAVLRDAVAYANAKGALVVAAAGNDGKTTYTYPAAYAEVLSVGATDTRTGGIAKASFSTYGSWVDVAAPGITAGMTLKGRYYQDNWTDLYPVQGTSFSSPLVAGVAALVASHRPAYTNWSLQRAITSSATKNSWTKFGRVNAAAALTKGADVVPPTATGFTPAANAKVRANAPITLTGAADDWSGVRKADLYVNGKWHSWDYTAPFAPVLKTAGRNGPITVELRLTDKAGNTKWLPIRTVIADNIVPAVSITKAPATKKKVKGTVKVYVKASDKSGISKVQLLVNGKVVATDTTAGYLLSFKVASQKKTMKVRVRAYDKAGNVKYTTIRTYYRA